MDENQTIRANRIIIEQINATDISEVGIYAFIITVLLGGFIGGITYFFHKLKLEKQGCTFETIKLESKAFWGMFFVSGTIGIGGAFALVAFRELNNSLDPYLIYNTKNVVFNFTLSVIAGFAARTLLPSIANKLEKQLSQQKEVVSQHSEELENQRKVIKRQSKKLNIQSERIKRQTKHFEEQEQRFKRIHALLMAEFALTDDSLPSDIEMGINALKDNLTFDKFDRKSAIMLARIYSERKHDYGEGIKVLKDFISKKEEVKEFDDDYSDVLYNLSCHIVEFAFKIKQTPEIEEELIKEALQKLKISIENKPDNIKDAEKEPEFEVIKDREDFKNIIPCYTYKQEKCENK